MKKSNPKTEPTASPAHPENYYPVFLDLRGKRCVVAGGGKVAERKALGLIKTGARVKVVSPTLTARLRREKEKGTISHTARRLRESDLEGAFLAIAATDSMEENKKVAAHRDLLVNVVDVPELCNFIVPSVLRRGPLAIAVSTSGASPAMARAMREDLEELYGPEFGAHLRGLAKKRRKAMAQMKDPVEREGYLKSLCSARTVKDLRIKTSGRGRRKDASRTK